MNSLIRYNSPAATISDFIDSIFNGQGFEAANRNFATNSWPKVDISESSDGFSLVADLPGINKSDLNIIVDNGTLRIEGERKGDYTKVEGKYYHLERSYGKFSRSFILPDEVDPEHIEAKMSNGVLYITLHKLEKAKPKTIEVKVE